MVMSYAPGYYAPLFQKFGVSSEQFGSVSGTRSSNIGGLHTVSPPLCCQSATVLSVRHCAVSPLLCCQSATVLSVHHCAVSPPLCCQSVTVLSVHHCAVSLPL